MILEKREFVFLVAYTGKNPSDIWEESEAAEKFFDDKKAPAVISNSEEWSEPSYITLWDIEQWEKNDEPWKFRITTDLSQERYHVGLDGQHFNIRTNRPLKENDRIGKVACDIIAMGDSVPMSFHGGHNTEYHTTMRLISNHPGEFVPLKYLKPREIWYKPSN